MQVQLFTDYRPSFSSQSQLQPPPSSSSGRSDAKNQPNQKPNFRAMRQSVRLFFCPLGAVSLPPVRHPCRPRAIPNAGGSYFSTPMDSDEKANHFTRWLPLSIEPEKFGVLVSPSPSCQSSACLPKVRAAPPSVRRSPDGAKPQGRTPRAKVNIKLCYHLYMDGVGAERINYINKLPLTLKKLYFCTG